MDVSIRVEIAGEPTCLATVSRDPDTGLYETFIGRPSSGSQLGRHDASQERAVEKAEDFPVQKLKNLL